MITFKQYISEGFLVDQREKMYAVKNSIVKAIKTPSFKVGVARASLDGERGIKWIIFYRLPKDHFLGNDVLMNIFMKVVKQELDKNFEEWKLSSAEIQNWEGEPTVFVRLFLPDGDGLLP